MRTTENILADLDTERAEHLVAGRLAEVQRVDQAVMAHQTLARLREEKARYVQAGELAAAGQVEAQIRYWRSMVDVDIEEPSTDAAAPPADNLLVGEQPAVTDPARPARQRR